MLEAQTAALLEAGCPLIVSTVGSDGEPRAARGWGLVVEPGSRHGALFLAAHDDVTLEHLRVTGRVAITAADVRTLRAVQLKGQALSVEPASAEDTATARRLTQSFVTAVVESDGTARHLLERLVPAAYVRCNLVFDEVYDQTPGPGAGASLGSAAP